MQTLLSPHLNDPHDPYDLQTLHTAPASLLAVEKAIKYSTKAQNSPPDLSKTFLK